MPKPKKKKHTYKKGLWGEYVAALWLRIHGYQIIKHRYKTPVGEIDLIVRNRKTLVCVEVKYRAHKPEGLYALSSHQQKRLQKAANYFLMTYGDTPIRFDFIIIFRYCMIYHVKGIMND